MEFQSTNPATGEIIWQGHRADPQQMDRAINAARKAQPAWEQLGFEARYAYLQKFNQILEARQAELAEVLSQDNGKPLWEAKSEISSMLAKLDVSKQAYLDMCKEVVKDQKGIKSITRYKPHGVVLVLAPFNFPGHLPNGHIIPALLAGNTIIYKPSELTPYISEKIWECWNAAELPHGVINMLQGDATVGKYLVERPDIDAVFFTGSFNVGQQIKAATLNQSSKILALEMGGNNPLIVASPDNIDAAVYNTIQSAFITAGQRCTCARRLIVLRDEAGIQFVEGLVNATKKLKVGAYTENPEPFLGPVISNAAADKIFKSYQELVKTGARAVVPMQRPYPNLAFLTPAILDVTDIKNIPDEEIFGPLLTLTWVDDFTSAISLANATSYGLSAGLIAADPQLYTQFYARIRAGIVNWNRPITGASSAAPFGGVGKSGNHRPGGYSAALYCSYAVASLEEEHLTLPATLSPGIIL